jgi:hypothetical protein
MDDTLLHYADQPVTLDRSLSYPQENLRGGKPHGLWVSVQGEDDWETWCRAEEFCLGSLQHVHRVVLRETADVLWLRTPQAVEAFHQEWSYETESERRMADDRMFGDHHGRQFLRKQWPVAWDKVVDRWDGIVIAPYQWSLRLGGPFWYWGVDCASGALWNLDAIESFMEVSQ